MPPIVTARGLVTHTARTPDEVFIAISAAFPKAARGGMDFTVPLGDCTANFYCRSHTTLEFHIHVTGFSNQNQGVVGAATEAEMLIRSMEILWKGITSSLRSASLRRRPELSRCHIEEPASTAALLVCEIVSPLKSPGARISYLFSGLFALTALVLVLWQRTAPQSHDTRQSNILGILLSLVVAAVSTPIPILVNWREWKRQLVWRYVRSGQ